jgi:predicted phage-related endonuclease
MNYQQWLEVRKQGIGSSDAATACGLNPYMSMLELWMIKTGGCNKTSRMKVQAMHLILGQTA